MQTFNTSENSLWITILVLTGLSLFENTSYMMILLFWVISILFTGNAKRIYDKNNSFLTAFLRRSMYFIPFLLPLFLFFEIFNDMFIFSFINIIIGLFVGIIFLIPNIKTWKVVLSKEFINMTLNNDRNTYLFNIYTGITAAFAEEIFFRGFILLYLEDQIIINSLLSIILFVSLHVGTKWNNIFKNKDYLIQVLFSIASIVMFLSLDSILPSIVAHLVYNSPHIYKNILSVSFLKKNQEVHN